MGSSTKTDSDSEQVGGRQRVLMKMLVGTWGDGSGNFLTASIFFAK